MSKLSKEQIKALINKGLVTHIIRLKCDGYAITLRDGIYKRKIRTRLYVDGLMSATWWLEPTENAESKFYLPAVVYRKKSTRSKKKERIELDMRQPDFASIGQALRHLNSVCDSVEVIEEQSNAN